MRFPAALALALLLASPAVAANAKFDQLAATVDVVAGATFCNGSAESARLAIAGWVDREIDNDRIRRIWEDAVEQRIGFFGTLPHIDCTALLARYDGFDLAAFAPSGVVSAATTGPTSEPLPAQREASVSDFQRLEPYVDGTPWRQVPDVPPAFHGFFGSKALCNLGAWQVTARSGIAHWADEPSGTRFYDAIFLSGTRVAVEAGGIVTVLEMTPTGDQQSLATIYPPHIALPTAAPQTLERCNRADLATFLPETVLGSFGLENKSASAGVNELCVLHEELISSLVQRHASGARVDYATVMNGQTYRMNQKLWYFIDRTIGQIYGGQDEDVRQRLQSGKWAEQCSSWLAFA
ncbi:hypothetical protein SAMN06295905_1953 [Devosia lucknowensis]|uniref:Uncharacterized protein n=1 Tax=Devosia lucknowensis TaxID=1096929 RepID=A0A1Y6FGV7_9HYPH|nr:hypothetical protein [Devosia lucknowensis]SMQ71653.1 hypothetical protein SAMN06295905_1953 [Devosia lucknowensis]